MPQHVGTAQLPLKKISTWVRIRPIGDMGHDSGEPVEKQLGAFDETCVNIISHDQRNSTKSYNYMSKVFPVDCTQHDVGADILPGMLEDFLSNRNAMLFAYGQTGTGKTHTIFGRPESLSEMDENDGWGLLPRAVHATLKHIEVQAKQGVHCVLLLSAVEFYCGQVYDLVDRAGKRMCCMRGHQVIGNSYERCDSPAMLAEFLERVYENRCVVATAMNDGSSRSHCAITATLMSMDMHKHSFKQTSFAFVDLAGAERPTKASHTGARITKNEAMIELGLYFRNGMKDTLSLELQGYLINLELHFLLCQVVGASDMAKKGKAYKSPTRMMGGSATQFLGGAMAGEARLGALICLSQSPQNGWETWFSIAQYGAQLAELRTRVKEVSSMQISKALAEAQREMEENAMSWSSRGSSASQTKFEAMRFGMKVYTEQRFPT